MKTSFLLRTILILSNLVPLIAAWMGRHLLAREDRFLWPYLIVYFLSGLGQLLLARFGLNNWWVIHLATVLELLFAGLLMAAWEPNAAVSRLFRFCIGAYVVVWTAAKLTVEPLSGAAPYTSSLAELMLLAASLTTLFQLSDRLSIPLQQSHRFWITSGLLLGAATDLFLWTLFPRMIDYTPATFLRVLYINWIRVLIVNVLYVRGFLCKPTPMPGGSLRSAP